MVIFDRNESRYANKWRKEEKKSQRKVNMNTTSKLGMALYLKFLNSDKCINLYYYLAEEANALGAG